MSYIGNQPPDIGAYDVESFDGGGTSFTLKRAATVSSVLLFIDGVRQTPTDAYTVSGTALTTTATTPSGTDNVTVMFMGDVVDIGAPSSDTITSAMIVDGSVANADMADMAANTIKVRDANSSGVPSDKALATTEVLIGDGTGFTAAALSGDVTMTNTGAVTIATDAVDIAMLSATGTASASTFLRGDNAWASAAAGLNSVQVFTASGTWTKPAGITKVIMEVQGAGASGNAYNNPNRLRTGAAGGYAKKFLDVSSISTSTITIGAGGTAVTGNNYGIAGGLSSWADGTNTISGAGGLSVSDVNLYAGEAGGLGSGGDINIQGQMGGPMQTSHFEVMNYGGNSMMGFSGGWQDNSSNDRYPNANGYGAGGGPGYTGAGTVVSGTGGPGIIVVWEYK